MKSITKKISLLLVLSATLFLSSCLDSDAGSWAGNEEYSYITQDPATNLVYARTIQGYFITSEKIRSFFSDGDIGFISYQINFDEAERTMIGDQKNIIVYHADLAGEPVKVAQTKVKFESVPDAPIVHFENIMTPIFSENTYFGDRWYFPFQVKLKKGEKVKANFYKVPDEGETSSDEVIIDIRLTKSGEAEDGATDKTVADFAVADFSDLRMMFEGSGKKELNLKFRFYRTINKDDLYTTTEIYTIHLK